MSAPAPGPRPGPPPGGPRPAPGAPDAPRPGPDRRPVRPPPPRPETLPAPWPRSRRPWRRWTSWTTCPWPSTSPVRRPARRAVRRPGRDRRRLGHVRPLPGGAPPTERHALVGPSRPARRRTGPPRPGPLAASRPPSWCGRPGQVAGAAATKPATAVDPATPVLVEEPSEDPGYVSRGGHKLAGALDAFGRTRSSGRRRCLDAGASTGGFTDVLLRRGAARGGRGRRGLRPAGLVAADRPAGARCIDRTNVRELTPERSAGRSTLTVADLSFISLRLVLPALAACTQPDADLLPMVKPQFEVGRELVGAGGVVRDPELRAAAVRRSPTAAYELGLGTRGVAAQPAAGPGRNVEYFLWLHRRTPRRPGRPGARRGGGRTMSRAGPARHAHRPRGHGRPRPARSASCCRRPGSSCGCWRRRRPSSADRRQGGAAGRGGGRRLRGRARARRRRDVPARRRAGPPVPALPLVGVNLGRVGFLAETEPEACRTPCGTSSSGRTRWRSG